MHEADIVTHEVGGNFSVDPIEGLLAATAIALAASKLGLQIKIGAYELNRGLRLPLEP